MLASCANISSNCAKLGAETPPLETFLFREGGVLPFKLRPHRKPPGNHKKTIGKPANHRKTKKQHRETIGKPENHWKTIIKPENNRKTTKTVITKQNVLKARENQRSSAHYISTADAIGLGAPRGAAHSISEQTFAEELGSKDNPG